MPFARPRLGRHRMALDGEAQSLRAALPRAPRAARSRRADCPTAPCTSSARNASRASSRCAARSPRMARVGELASRGLSGGGSNAAMKRRNTRAPTPTSASVDRFGRIVADAVLAADEQHADRRDVDDRHAVVARAGRQRVHAASPRLRWRRAICCCSAGAHAAVLPPTAARSSTVDVAPLRRSLAVARGSPRSPRAALLVRRRAHVEREADVAGNDVDRARRGFELADGADDVRLARAARFDGEHAFGRRRQRVAAQRHRHRARMPGHARRCRR